MIQIAKRIQFGHGEVISCISFQTVGKLHLFFYLVDNVNNTLGVVEGWRTNFQKPRKTQKTQ